MIKIFKPKKILKSFQIPKFHKFSQTNKNCYQNSKKLQNSYLK